MAQTLTELRTYAAELELALSQLADGALTIQIGGRTLTRLSPRQIRAELNGVNMEINRRESGGAFPFDQTIRFTQDSENA